MDRGAVGRQARLCRAQQRARLAGARWHLFRMLRVRPSDELTSGTLLQGSLLQGTRKPFKTWFRAVFEISSRRNRISAKDLQRIMGFGSYETAWTWLRKLRVALVRPEREPLSQHVQSDEGFVGGKRWLKSMVLVVP